MKHVRFYFARRPWVLLLALWLTAAGCARDGGSAQAPGIESRLCYEAAIYYGDFEGRGRLEAENRELFSLTFYEPESIGGFCATLENGVCRYAMDGVELAHKPGSLPAPDVSALLFLPLQSVMRGEHGSVSLSGEVWVYEGMTANSLFLVTQNRETGTLVSVAVPQLGFEALLLPGQE